MALQRPPPSTTTKMAAIGQLTATHGATCGLLPAVFLAVVALTAGGVSGQPMADSLSMYPTLQSYPDPLTNPQMCGNPTGQPSLICDPANVLTQQEFSMLSATLASIRDKGICPCHDNCVWAYTLAVAIVPDVTDLYRYSSVDDALELFARNLMAKWDHGTCGENAISVYSVHHKKMFSMMGVQARVRLEDECRTVIDNRVNERLTQGLYPAVSLMAHEYREFFNGKTTCADKERYKPTEIVYVVLIFVCILLLFGLMYFFIVCFKKYAKRRNDNNVKLIPVTPARVALNKNHVGMLSNKPAVPSNTKDEVVTSGSGVSVVNVGIY